MKIKKEDEKFLLELSKKMNAQNNRATQCPLFVVQSKIAKYNEEGSEIERKEETIDAFDHSLLCEKCEDIQEKGDDLPDFCDDCDPDLYDRFDLVYETVETTGAFLTAEAAQKHIDENHYHYVDPRVYGTGTWRNDEMQRLLSILSKISNDGKPLSHYQN